MQNSVENRPKVGENSGAQSVLSTPSAPLTAHAEEVSDDMADSDSTPGKSPAFQFYPKDFITDERVTLMSMQERGVYITLICKCWTEGTLPSDLVLLARLCGFPSAAFRKCWTAIAPCFRPCSRDASRLVHPRLEKERQKQRAYRRRQADNGRKGGRPPQSGKPTANPSLSAPGFPKESFALSDLRSSSSSSDSRQKTAAAPEARSKRPIYTSDLLAVFEWQLDDLSKTLGRHFEDFDIHGFFDQLTQQSRADGLVLPRDAAWEWLQAQVLAEAKRRGLPIASAEPVRDRAAEQRAQDERIFAEIQQEKRLRAGR